MPSSLEPRPKPLTISPTTKCGSNLLLPILAVILCTFIKLIFTIAQLLNYYKIKYIFCVNNVTLLFCIFIITIHLGDQTITGDYLVYFLVDMFLLYILANVCMRYECDVSTCDT